MTPIIKKLAYKTITAVLRNQTKRLIKQNPKLVVVGITGSVGKTTTKRAMATVLGEKFKVIAHPGNYNTEIGVPLSLFELETPGKMLHPAWIKILWEIEKKLRQRFQYEVAILEMGADQVGEIEYFMKFITPDYGVVTAVKPAHMEGFKSLENILMEKFKLAIGSKFALLNATEERLMTKLSEIDPAKVALYGTDSADYYYKIDDFDLSTGFTGTMHLKEASFPVKLKLLARHNIHAAVAAAAVASMLGMSKTQIKSGLEKVRPVSGRMNPLAGMKDTLIIDDSYNSNPEAVTAALDTLYGLEGRKIAILGMMNEMGPFSKQYHEEIGLYANKLDYLATIGADAKQYLAPAAIKAGLKKDRVESFDNPYSAGEWVLSKLKSGDKVLVKGSQGKVFSEEATAILLEDPQDRKKLVRQSPFWQKLKQEAFNHEA